VAAHVVKTSAAATSTTPALVKGTTVHLSAALETALTAFILAASFRDTTGETVGVSN
jgi:hypothetical protein